MSFRIKILLFAHMIVGLFLSTAWASVPSDLSYYIGAGDVLEVDVFRHPDLSREVRVRPDGKISFPWADDIPVAGQTPLDVKVVITNRLSRVLRNPEVTVNLLSFESKKIIVMGDVVRPGVYTHEAGMTVVDALGYALGHKETAAMKSVIVIRKNADGDPEALRVNIWQAITKAVMDENVALAPGDIVFVPQTFIAKLNRFLDQFLTKTDPVLKYWLGILDIENGGRPR